MKRRQTQTRKGSGRGSSKKSDSSVAVKKPQEPLFPLYKDPSKPSFREGLHSVLQWLSSCKNIVVLTGAGISVSCGIPDFRTVGSGLYATLDYEALGLASAEELFDYEVFLEQPEAFFAFAKHLYFPRGVDQSQRPHPSDSHKLLALLEQNNRLLRVYSQNVDGLEQQAGVSSNKMVYCHGSLCSATCLRCKRKVSAKEMEADILAGTVARCQAPVHSPPHKLPRGENTSSVPTVDSRVGTRASSRKKRPRPSLFDSDKDDMNNNSNNTDNNKSNYDTPKTAVCNGVLKPGVTFFGEALSDQVSKCLQADRHKVDALIVMGTSLSVAPISKVIDYFPSNIPRILINRTIVHPLHSATNGSSIGGAAVTQCNADSSNNDSTDNNNDNVRQNYVFDAYLLGYCDDVTRTLAKQLLATNDVNNTCSDDSTTTNSSSSDTTSLGDMEECCRLLANLTDDDEEIYNKSDWSGLTVPADRVFLFPGAQPRMARYGNVDENETERISAEATTTEFREIAHCDGCSSRIEGIIQKCTKCFDYDLCSECYPVVSKTHYDGNHSFCPETAG